MDLAEVSEQLYAADPGEFVTLRTAAVKQARAAKDKELADRIGALRRPTRSAWLVNRLAREDGQALGELLDLGPAMAAAQRNAAGAELRTLSAQRNAAVGALVRRAAELGAGHGHQATEATRTEVGQILTAALADPALADVVRVGQVTQAVTYGGFGPDLIIGNAPADALLPAPASLDHERAGRRSAEERREEATVAAERAAADLERARAERDAAESAEHAAQEELATADRALAAARRELSEREASQALARQTLDEATERREQCRRDAIEAEQAATRAAQDLRKLR